MAPLDESALSVDGKGGRLATFLATGWDSKTRQLDFDIAGATVRRGLFTKTALDVLRESRGRVNGLQLREALEARMKPKLDELRLSAPQLRGSPSDDVLRSILLDEAQGEATGELLLRPTDGLEPPALLRVDDWPPTTVAAGQDPADPWRWRLPVGLYVPSLDGKSAKVRFQVYPGVQTVADLGPELFQ